MATAEIPDPMPEDIESEVFHAPEIELIDDPPAAPPLAAASEVVELRNTDTLGKTRLLVRGVTAVALGGLVATALKAAGNRRNPNQTNGGWVPLDLDD